MTLPLTQAPMIEFSVFNDAPLAAPAGALGPGQAVPEELARPARAASRAWSAVREAFSRLASGVSELARRAGTGLGSLFARCVRGLAPQPRAAALTGIPAAGPQAFADDPRLQLAVDQTVASHKLKYAIDLPEPVIRRTGETKLREQYAKQCEAYLQQHVVDPVKAGRIPFGTTEEFLNRLDEAALEFGKRYDNAADKIRKLHSNYTLQNEILLQYMLSDTPDIIYFAEKNN